MADRPEKLHPRQVARMKHVFQILAVAIHGDDQEKLDDALAAIDKHAKPHEIAAELAHPNRVGKFFARILKR